MASPRGVVSPGDPYCGNCGYVLKDLGRASVCPECGRALVEVLVRHSHGVAQTVAIRIRSEVTVFGWPLYHVAFGPQPEFGERRGVAKGVIAIGDVAIGGVALGGVAMGGVAVGGCAVGLGAIGGLGLAALSAIGGGAVGGVAIGGLAVGGFATGGAAVGYAAQGGGAWGIYARGGQASGVHVVGGGRSDAEAVARFKQLAPIMGFSARGVPGMAFASLPMISVVPALAIDALVLLAVGLLVIAGKGRGANRDPMAKIPVPDARASAGRGAPGGAA
jgi:hypothetical protein